MSRSCPGTATKAFLDAETTRSSCSLTPLCSDPSGGCGHLGCERTELSLRHVLPPPGVPFPQSAPLPSDLGLYSIRHSTTRHVESYVGQLPHESVSPLRWEPYLTTFAKIPPPLSFSSSFSPPRTAIKHLLCSWKCFTLWG